MFLLIDKSSSIILFLCLMMFYSLNTLAQEKELEHSILPDTGRETQSPEFEIDNALELKTKDKFLSDINSENSEKTISEGNLNNADEKSESLGVGSQTEIKPFNYNFRQTPEQNEYFHIDDELIVEKKFFAIPSLPNSIVKDNDAIASEKSADIPERGFGWGPAIRQSLMFLAVQHGYALTQPKTRESLKGNFFKDYAKSVKSLSGWNDGGKFFTNYIAHPMQGSLTGFIYVQNDPKAKKQQFGMSGDYWRSRMKAMAWSAAWSTQFEIGPVSQASIGNVGLSGKQTWVDIVVTPTVGTAMLITEDALDRFVMQRIERKTNNFYIRIFLRMLLSPTRVFANMLRYKTPWYRDRSYDQ